MSDILGSGVKDYGLQLRSSAQYRTEILRHIDAYVADPAANVWRLVEIEDLQSRLARTTFADRLAPHTLAWVDRWISPVAVKSPATGTTK